MLYHRSGRLPCSAFPDTSLRGHGTSSQRRIAHTRALQAPMMLHTGLSAQRSASTGTGCCRACNIASRRINTLRLRLG